MTDQAQAPLKTMRLRYAGTCRECGLGLPAGTSAAYDSASKTVICAACLTPAQLGAPAQAATPVALDDSPFDPGTAGASAQREFDKRKARRDTRIRTDHPRLGGLILALSDEPQSTTAWAKGARGEVVLGRRLDTLASRGFHVLHDRRIPGTKANVDHIVVGASGIFVVDAKRYTGHPSLRVEGGVFRPRTEKLMVGSRDCTKLVDGLLKQVRDVTSALEKAGIHGAPIRGMLCFVEADWPLIGGSFTTGGVEVLWPAKAVERMLRPGVLDAAAVETAARVLASHFPVA